MPLASQQRTANHRARKAALVFSKDYLKGVFITTPEAFTEGKEAPFCVKYQRGHVKSTVDLSMHFMNSSMSMVKNMVYFLWKV